MKKFILRGAILILLILLTDFLIGQIFGMMFNKVRSGSVYNTTYGIRDCKDQILIMGDSEVKHGLVSNLFSDSLGMSCYNLGLDGNNVFFQYGMLREIVNRYTPEIIIISKSIALEAESSVTSLFPFYDDFLYVKETILEIAPAEKYKLISKAYMYNSLLLKIVPGIFRSDPETGGYSPLFSGQNRMNYNLVPDTVYFKGKSTTRSRGYYDKFIRLAVSAGSRVIVITAPRFSYVKYAETDEFNEIVQNDDVIYLEYENDPTFTGHADYFYDEFHLNHKGAVVLTNRIIYDIKHKIPGLDDFPID